MCAVSSFETNSFISSTWIYFSIRAGRRMRTTFCGSFWSFHICPCSSLEQTGKERVHRCLGMMNFRKTSVYTQSVSKCPYSEDRMQTSLSRREINEEGYIWKCHNSLCKAFSIMFLAFLVFFPKSLRFICGNWNYDFCKALKNGSNILLWTLLFDFTA